MHISNHCFSLSYLSRFEIKWSFLWLPREVDFFFCFLGFFNWEGKKFCWNAHLTIFSVLTNKFFYSIQRIKLLKHIPSHGEERLWVTLSCIWSLHIYCMWWLGLSSWLVSKNCLDCSLVSARCRCWSTHPAPGEQCHTACDASVTLLSVYILRRYSTFLNI